MLEVVFSDSEKGSMKVAKNYNAKTMLGGANGYIGKKPTKAELEKHFEGQSVGGNSQDVVNIGFFLDIGGISGEIDGNERQDIFRKLWGRFVFDKKEQEQFFQNQRRDMEKLLSAAKDGIPIRIWKSNAPYSACGFHFVCHLLENIDCNIIYYIPKLIFCLVCSHNFIHFHFSYLLEIHEDYQKIPAWNSLSHFAHHLPLLQEFEAILTQLSFACNPVIQEQLYHHDHLQ
jgi:hypothetical protein